MAVSVDRIEIERVDNLIRNFGWSKIKEEFTDNDIILTVKKPRALPVPELGEGAD